ncbi:MAG: prepilin peptidase [Eubacteriales bacterium]|nr:prepilin peptidase [Eubacteriales bacterium]
MLLLTITGVSVIMDLRRMQVKNSWILCSLFAGAGYCLWKKGFSGLMSFVPGALMPLAVLGWMFYFRLLGPGDIKVFCALGGIMGPAKILWCIWFSFLSGAGISLAVLICCGGFLQRMAYLAAYIREYFQTGSPKPYYQRGNALENIHFTIPIFMSVMLYAGGLY